jgi:hypothetical protein
MKKTRTVSTVLTEEEYEQFKKAWMDAENMTGERMSVSKFLRHTILTSLNGDNPDSEPEIVSTPAIHTDSEQKNKDALWNNIDVD